MRRATIIVASFLLVLAVLFIALRWREPAPVEPLAKSTASTNHADSQTNIPPAAIPSGPPATIEEGKSETEKVTRMITAFHTRMGENPVGTNAEITKALMGGNPVHATFSADTPRLNAKGELLDPWGTPYFFHQISGNQMEIHSAGPDKIMGTADDIIEN